MVRSVDAQNAERHLDHGAPTTCMLLTLGLVVIAPLLCLASPGFVPCMTPDGPGYQTVLGELQCIFTNAGVQFVRHPPPAPHSPGNRLDSLVPGSFAQKTAATGTVTAFRLEFGEKCASLAPEGRRPRRELTNVYVGRSPDRWLTARPACDEVVYRQACEGADLVFSRTAEGLTYEFVGEGASAARVASFHWTDITPGAYAAGAKGSGSRDNRLQLSPDFGIAASGTLRWGADEYRPERPITMTATRSLDASSIAWATYLGGATNGDYAWAIGVAAGDRPAVGGFTWSTDYPVSDGALQDTLGGGEYDAMISALDPETGQLLWSTYLGGEDLDETRSIGRAITGNVLVAGYTWSSAFPTTPGAYDSTLTSGEAAFVAELDAANGQLVWLTLVNGTNVRCLAVARDGGVVFTGRSYAGGAPVTAGAYDEIFHGGVLGDGIVVRLSADGRNLDWCTYLGGSAQDVLIGVALDSYDNVIVGGFTVASPTPVLPYPATVGAYDVVPGIGTDGVVSKLSADGRSLLWSTYLGSDGGNYVHAVSVLPNDDVVVAGYSTSLQYPVTPDAFQGVRGAVGPDAIVTVLGFHGDALAYSTYLGGNDMDVAYGMCVGENGQVIVSGGTASVTFPGPTDPEEWVTSGEWDWFVAEFRGAPLTLARSLVLGGSNWDQKSYVARGANNSIYLLGDTASDGLPTSPGAFQPSLVGGGRDLYVAKLSSWVTPVMIDGLRACRVGARARVEWVLSGAGSGEAVGLWRETAGATRQQVASWDRLRAGAISWEDPLPPAGATSYWLQMAGAAGEEIWFGPALLQAVALPKFLRLTAGVPNPFNPRTMIRYSLPQPAHATLGLYDQRGRLVTALVDEDLPAGEQSVEWDGRDAHGALVASGAYIVRLVTEQGVRTSKITLAK